MKRFLISLLVCLNSVFAFSQNQNLKDSNKVVLDTSIKVVKKFYPVIDSAALARKNFIRDSISSFYLYPDASRENPYFKKLIEENLVTDPWFLSLPKNFKAVKVSYGLGNYIIRPPMWFLYTLLILLIGLGIVKASFPKQVSTLFRAFYDSRILAQLNKEDNALVSWQFLTLYILFCLTLSFFICLVLLKVYHSAPAKNIEVFFVVSGFVFLFFSLKILVLRFIGYLFQVQKLVRDYLVLIYLTYFNSLFLLLPMALCLILINFNQENIVLDILLVAAALAILIPFLRIMIKILLNHRLSKFYLILYLCALEVCPLILFAKTINISL